jgi:hypothetical protein
VNDARSVRWVNTWHARTFRKKKRTPLGVRDAARKHLGIRPFVLRKRRLEVLPVVGVHLKAHLKLDLEKKILFFILFFLSMAPGGPRARKPAAPAPKPTARSVASSDFIMTLDENAVVPEEEDVDMDEPQPKKRGGKKAAPVQPATVSERPRATTVSSARQRY